MPTQCRADEKGYGIAETVGRWLQRSGHRDDIVCADAG